ncbi:ricin-type beta-trefoil lectin domain protein [Streptomyces sp. NPDC058417]|uniref:RICIN domain-containing protein n=1 Tax=unclassified Streptomyces TaxID=2593676 RepID=UPI003649CC11
MKDAGLSNSPSVRRFDVTDVQLSAELKNWTGASPALHPVGELLDRHWEAAFAYARLCADGERAAGMLTTAAFTRLFGETLRQNGPSAAWRPHLLLTVRRIAAEWDSDGRRDLLHPDLRAAEGDSERLAARLLPPANRRLLSRAFHRLPQSARCLLWHTEIEAEPLAVPAGLLGLEEDGAAVELRRARERLREECLQVHREQAVDEECQRYHRLLDVTCRRGGTDLDPDLRAHLEGCRHCLHTAEQLRRFETGIGTALAESVLGWAAEAYLRARTEPTRDERVLAAPPAERLAAVGEAFTVEMPVGGTPGTDHASGAPAISGGPGAPVIPGTSASSGLPAVVPAPPVPSDALGGPQPDGPHRRSGRARRPGTDLVPVASAGSGAGRRPASSRTAQKANRRARRRNLALAVLTVSGLVVLPLVLWSTLSGSDRDAASADDSPVTPGKAPSDPAWVGIGDEPQGTLRGSLHNVSSGLCIGIIGKQAAKGAETEVTKCSGTPAQQWSYEPDGLLRNGADPGLCLDSGLGYSVRLATCTGAGDRGAKSVRYDFTLQGTLVPRSDQNLALAPAATDGSGALVLKNRTDSGAQRWVIDTSQPDPKMQSVNWDLDGAAPRAPVPAPSASRTPAPGRTTPTPSAAPRPPAPAPVTPPPPAVTYPPICREDARGECVSGGQDGGWYPDDDYDDGYGGGYDDGYGSGSDGGSRGGGGGGGGGGGR